LICYLTDDINSRMEEYVITSLEMTYIPTFSRRFFYLFMIT
jgi:hypothetical protein